MHISCILNHYKLKKQQKRESSRWLMLKRQNEMNEAEEAAARPPKLKLVDHDDHAYVVVPILGIILYTAAIMISHV